MVKLTACIREKYSIAADINPSHRMSAEIRLPTIIREGDFDTYDGETEFTPTQEMQIIETENKIVKQNFTINPIPQNYGLITWNGHHLTVS